MGNATSLFVLSVVCIIAVSTDRANAELLKVVPDTSSPDAADGVYSLVGAIEKAVAGDTIELGAGTYTDRIRSIRPGEKGKPIIITGSRQAVLKAGSPCVEIAHSWIRIEVSIYCCCVI